MNIANCSIQTIGLNGSLKREQLKSGYSTRITPNFSRSNKITCTPISINNFHAYSNISFKASLKEHLGQGARYLGDNKTKFTLTTPYAEKVEVKILDENLENERIEELERISKDKFSKVIPDVKAGSKYIYQVTKQDGRVQELYDPRADYLPFDVQDYQLNSNYAEVVDHSNYKWTDWKWMNSRKSSNEGARGWGIPKNMIIETVHIGLLDGFKNAKKELDNIQKTGIANAVRVMPIGEFYGKYNWGYDEVAKFAPENSYGTPDEFKDFVNHAHEKGISVILDVVLNHFGPYGANLNEYVPTYHNDKETSWGKVLKFGGEDGKYVRSYMNDMLMNWAVNYHVDGFRFDATHCLDSDEGMQEILKDLRSHKETKDLILYPEDMRISRTMANSNLPKEVNKTNWGYSGQTTFDFYKSLIANVTKQEKHGIKPDLFQLAYIYENTILDSHEANMLRQKNLSLKDREQYEKNLQLPKQNADNFIINFSNHDEIGNDAGGKRNLPSILSSRLNIHDRFGGNWQAAQKFTFDLLKNYGKNDTCISYDDQKRYGCKWPISQEELYREISNSFELNKLMLGATFMYPGTKEFFMGDERAELSPLKYFCEFPEDAINPINSRKYIDEIADEKGYKPDRSAFADSKIRQKTYEASWMNNGTERFCKDFAKLIKTLPVFNTCDADKVCTYVFPKDDVLEFKRYDDYGHEVIAVMNFSDRPKFNYCMQRTSDQYVREILNSNNSKYCGSGMYLNKDRCNTKNGSITIPPLAISVFVPEMQANNVQL